MHKGKHLGRKKKVGMNKPTLLLTSLILVIGIMVGTAAAFLIALNGPIQNVFQPSKVSCSVEETFQNEVKTNVSVENTGDIAAYIRAAVVVTWKDANGNVYPQTPTAGEDYQIKFASDTGWDTQTSDGFYYFTSPVEPGQSTGILIESCSPVEGKTPAGYGLSVEILGSAIQSVPTSVVVDQWGVTLDGVTISK